MFYEVKTFVSQEYVIPNKYVIDQHDKEWIVLSVAPTRIDGKQYYIYQVMENI